MAGYSTMPPPPINSLNVIQKSHASFSFTTSRLSHHPPTDIRSFWMVVEPANQLLQVDGGHMPPSTGQPFQRLCYFHLTANQRRALCIYRRSPRSHSPRRQSYCRRMPTRRLHASSWGRSHRDRQVLVHHLLSDASNSGR